MARLCILQLSDLHWQLKQRNDISRIQKALIKDVTTLRERHSLVPDVVVFCGDLVQAGDEGPKDAGGGFLNAMKMFVHPVIESLGLKPDTLILCPGNHDVQKSRINKHLDAGLDHDLVDRTSVNCFLDEQGDPIYFAMLEGFRSFSNGGVCRQPDIDGKLFSVHKLDVRGSKVGISVFNSAWRSKGEGDRFDYGNLLIGERTVTDAVDSIADCDIKIGVMHHPFEYLREFERQDLRQIAHSAFDMWLSGHTHHTDTHFVHYSDTDGILVSNAGCLYQSREYFNGYLLIDYPLDRTNALVYMREYVPRSDKFAAAIAYSPDESGIFQFQIRPEESRTPARSLTLVSQLRDQFEIRMQDMLVPTGLDRLSKPRTLKDIFVCPPLHSIPEGAEFLDVTLSTDEVKLEALLESDANVLFLGKRESGKTTLLHYICSQYLEIEMVRTARIPILINNHELPSGKGRIHKAVFSCLTQYDSKIDIEDALGNGSIVLLIDDVDIRNSKTLTSLAEFMKAYPKVRLFLATNVDLYTDVLVDHLHVQGIALTPVFIHSYRFNQVSMLINKWFGRENTLSLANLDLVQNVSRCIADINLPRTPFVVSLLLRIIEQQAELMDDPTHAFLSLNKATLVEKFVEILLEKTYSTQRKFVEIDYRIKEDFLSEIAHEMFVLESDRLTIDDFKRKARDYFGKLGFSNIDAFTDYLVTQGAFGIADGSIAFRFRAFREYFLAKFAIENSEFYQRIISENEYLKLYHEIDYLTGLQRKNRDIVEALVSNALRLWTEIHGEDSVDASLDLLRALLSDVNFFDEESPDAPKDLGVTKQETDADLSTLLSVLEQQRLDSKLIEMISGFVTMHYDETRNKLEYLTSLSAIAVRNCELIRDTEFRRSNLVQVIQLFLVEMREWMVNITKWVDELAVQDPSLFLELCNRSPNTGQRSLPEPGTPEYDSLVIEFRNSNKLLMLIAYLHQLSMAIGNPKHRVEIRSICGDPLVHPAVRVACAGLSSTMRLPGYMDLFDGIIKDLGHAGDSEFLEMLSMIITKVYFGHELSPTDSNRIEDMLARIRAILLGPTHHSGRLASRVRDKSRTNFITDLRATKAKLQV